MMRQLTSSQTQTFLWQQILSESIKWRQGFSFNLPESLMMKNTECLLRVMRGEGRDHLSREETHTAAAAALCKHCHVSKSYSLPQRYIFDKVQHILQRWSLLQQECEVQPLRRRQDRSILLQEKVLEVLGSRSKVKRAGNQACGPWALLLTAEKLETKTFLVNICGCSSVSLPCTNMKNQLMNK